MKIDPDQSPCTILKPKWIKDFNIEPTTMKIIEEEVGSIHEHIGTGVHFLDLTPPPLPCFLSCDYLCSFWFVFPACEFWALCSVFRVDFMADTPFAEYNS